jgi:hypothetical protein
MLLMSSSIRQRVVAWLTGRKKPKIKPAVTVVAIVRRYVVWELMMVELMVLQESEQPKATAATYFFDPIHR